MAHNPCTELDGLEAQVGQKPVGHGFGRPDTAEEDGKVAGQRVQLQPHLVVADPPASEPRAADGVFAYADRGQCHYPGRDEVEFL